MSSSSSGMNFNAPGANAGYSSGSTTYGATEGQTQQFSTAYENGSPENDIMSELMNEAEQLLTEMTQHEAQQTLPNSGMPPNPMQGGGYPTGNYGGTVPRMPSGYASAQGAGQQGSQTGAGATGNGPPTGGANGASATNASAPVMSPSGGATQGGKPAPDPSVSDSETAWKNNDPQYAATQSWKSKDDGQTGAGYEQYAKDIKNGDGNAAVRDIHNALQAGDLTPDQAKTLYYSAEDNARQNGGGNLDSQANSTMGQDLANSALSKWGSANPPDPDYQKYQDDAKKGDGNAMVADIHKAMTEGKISKQDAAAAYAQTQRIAWANGGGRLDSKASETAGVDTTNAYAPQWAQRDPASYKKFCEDQKKGDGNAMVSDVHDAMKSGALTQDQASNMYAQCENFARVNGGGNLSGDASNIIKNDGPQISGYEHYQGDLKKGDGNSAVNDINAAMQNGILSQSQASVLFANAEPTAAKNGGGDLSWGARSVISDNTATDVGTQWYRQDPKGMQKFLVDAQNGDGNAMVDDVNAAYKSGYLTKSQATNLLLMVPQTGTKNGSSGCCDSEHTKIAQDISGDPRVLDGGMSHSLYEFEKTGLALFCAPAAGVLSAKLNQGDTLSDSMAGAQQAGTDQSALAFKQASPQKWAEFQQQMHNGDGNAAAQTLLSMKGTLPDSYISAIAGQMQGDLNSGASTSLNNYQGGPVSGQISGDIRNQFQQALGLNYDPFAAGKSVAAINAEKAGAAISTGLGLGGIGYSAGAAGEDSALGDKDAMQQDLKSLGISIGGSALDAIPGADMIGEGLSMGTKIGVDGLTEGAKTGAQTGMGYA